MSAAGGRDKQPEGTGMVHVYTGDGKGKTTAALGLAVRAMGHGMRVYICQFLKGRLTGELKSFERFAELVKIDRFGRPGFVLPDGITDEDRRLAAEGFQTATGIVKSGRFDLVILDEIGPACELGLIEPGSVAQLIRSRPPDLVLLDIMLPDIDGWQILEYKGQDEAMRDIPVIVISTQSPTEQSMTSDVLLTTIGQGLSVSKLLRCSLQFSKLLLTPDSEPDLGPG